MLQNLKPETLEAILNTLPVDITFVDGTDTIVYYNEGKGRISGRTPEIIGRKVQECHSPQSRDKVEKVVNDLRSGRRMAAELQLGNRSGRRIYTRYFPVKDEAGNYLGTLEVVQDITDIQKIKGEKRLPDVA